MGSDAIEHPSFCPSCKRSVRPAHESIIDHATAKALLIQMLKRRETARIMNGKSVGWSDAEAFALEILRAIGLG